MKKFVVSYMSYFDGDVELEQVEARDPADAIRVYLRQLDDPFECESIVLEDMIDELSNMDIAVSVLEIV